MNLLVSTPSYNPKRTIIWLVGVFFLLFQFFLQLSSGIIIGAIMHEKQLTAFTAGLLSSAFYYVYTTMQIPVGLLFDRYNTRTLLFLNALLCALGCFIFSSGYNLFILFLGRLIIGGGSAFAFVGMTRILRQHYPLKQYAFMIGLTETLGFTVTVISMIGMGSQISRISWHYFLAGAGVIGLLIAFLCANFIPSNKPIITDHHQYKKHLLLMLKNKLVWINGLFVGLEFSVITVFAAMWAVPFLQLKLECSLETASILTSMVLLGAGLSCPLYGWLSINLPKRKPLIHISCLSTAILFILVLYLPIYNIFLTGILLFAIGLCCGAYMLAFTIANELAPEESLSACTGFTNTLAMATAPLLQPLVGYLLDFSKGETNRHVLADYQLTLLIIPAALVIASALSQFLPEKEA
ncbi:major facilitator family transporter [Legionella steigerwaltii]|uniref:Lysosomal dipeptide transporter MFSD1 n=1 Tax=Legionella steigerwaltii TaxID=460 RepID=A0A378L9E4_9GAMM|nr:MFS transporter [Legionella steigerwaltii]KTD80879.1 major facilitator family transporter [Legionella steigerwaltii]STY23433.1 major facilitator family transporter [Legionella steigerwaltii]